MPVVNYVVYPYISFHLFENLIKGLRRENVGFDFV